MKIVIEPAVIHAPLAKEIGMEESIILLGLDPIIRTNGTDYKGHKALCWGDSQLKANFQNWFPSVSRIKKALDRLVDRNLVFVSPVDSNYWIALNWSEIRTLKSIIILTDEEAAQTVPLPKAKVNGNGNSHYESLLEKAMFYAWVRSCNLNREHLQPRDIKEIKEANKKLIQMYGPSGEYHKGPIDIYPMIQRILGINCWWKRKDQSRLPLRPLTAIGQWPNYADYCHIELKGRVPALPAEWLSEFQQYRA